MNKAIVKRLLAIFTLFLLCLISSPALGQVATKQASSATKLSLPRFVSIKFNEVNARTGPAIDCPIEWVFLKKGEVVELTAEYGQWRKIRDVKQEGGWVHKGALDSKRSVVVISKDIIPLYASIPLVKGDGADYHKQAVIAQIAPMLRCKLIKCQQQWCKVDCNKYQGWLERAMLWGVYNHEFP